MSSICPRVRLCAGSTDEADYDSIDEFCKAFKTQCDVNFDVPHPINECSDAGDHRVSVRCTYTGCVSASWRPDVPSAFGANTLEAVDALKKGQ